MAKKENNESWTWHNLSVATALILIVAGLALCCWLAPDAPKRATVYQNNNLSIQCIEKKAGACERITINDKGVNNDRK